MKKIMVVLAMALPFSAVADIVDGDVIQRTSQGVLVSCSQEKPKTMGQKYAQGLVMVYGATNGVGTKVHLTNLRAAGDYKYTSVQGAEQIVDAYGK